jgi:glycosyltransferase involved in cell wall biosynthesis
MGTGGSQLVTGLGSQCVLGYIDHERTRVLAFNAADLFVHPAPVDNLPNVVMESIACGTPVVGFPTGGVAEMVRPGQTGWLASTISAEELAKTIVRALDDSSDPASMRQSCRAIAEAEYGVGVQAQRYLQLYGELLVSVGAS